MPHSWTNASPQEMLSQLSCLLLTQPTEQLETLLISSSVSSPSFLLIALGAFQPHPLGCHWDFGAGTISWEMLAINLLPLKYLQELSWRALSSHQLWLMLVDIDPSQGHNSPTSCHEPSLLPKWKTRSDAIRRPMG